MGALAWRQALAAIRLPAVWIALVFYVAALALYLVVWGDGVPLAGARSPFEQFATAQSILVLVMLPWVAARCAATPHRDAVVTLAVLSARRPSGVVIGACIGLVGVACAVALTGLPLAIVSQQIADRAMADLAAAQLRMLSLSAWATVLTLAAVLVSGSRVGGWLIATVATSIVSRFVPAGTPGSLAIVAAAVCAAGALAQQADQTWQHRAEWRP